MLFHSEMSNTRADTREGGSPENAYQLAYAQDIATYFFAGLTIATFSMGATWWAKAGDGMSLILVGIIVFFISYTSRIRNIEDMSERASTFSTWRMCFAAAVFGNIFAVFLRGFVYDLSHL